MVKVANPLPDDDSPFDKDIVACLKVEAGVALENCQDPISVWGLDRESKSG